MLFRSNCGDSDYPDIYGEVGAGGVRAAAGGVRDYVYPCGGWAEGIRLGKPSCGGCAAVFEYKLEE